MIERQAFATTVRTWFGLLALPLLLGGCTNEPEPTANWEHSLSGLYAAAVSNSGQFAVVSSPADGTGYWNLQTNGKLWTWRHNDSNDDQISRVAFAPSDSHVITADTRSFVVWDANDGEALGYWSVDTDISDIAISNEGRYVLLGLKDGRAIHINQRTQRRIEVIAHQNERVTTVDLSDDGIVAVTGGNDGRVMVWNAMTGDELHVFAHEGRIALAKLAPSHAYLFTADDTGSAFVWDLNTGEKRSTLALAKGQHAITAARFSEDGSKVLLGFPGRDVRLWDATQGNLVNEWRTPRRKRGWVPQGSSVYSVAFNAQDATVVAESSNGLGSAWHNSPTH